MKSTSYIHQIQTFFTTPRSSFQLVNLIRFSSYFLVSILLVKGSVDISTIGQYEYVLYVATILSTLWMNGSMQSFLVHCQQKSNIEIERIFQNFSIYLFLISISLWVLFWVFGSSIVAFFKMAELPSGFFYYLIFHFIYQGSYLMVYKFLLTKQWSQMYLFGMAHGILYVGIFSILLFSDIRLFEAFEYLAIGSIPFLFWWIIESKIWQKVYTISMNWKGISALILIQWIAYFSLWSDGWWVQYYFGIGDEFTYFRYGAREFPLFVVLTSAFSTIAIGLINPGEKSNQSLAQIKQGSRRFILRFTPILMILMLSSHWLFSTMYAQEFIYAAQIFDLYLCLVLARVVFIRSIYIGLQHYQPLIYISLIELLSNLVLSYLLYPYFGLIGLIMATLIAHFLELILSMGFLRFRYQIPIKAYLPIKVYLGLVCLCALLYWIKYAYLVG